ncbi:sensor histidine kinase [Acidihalobacter prosperus]
MSESDRTTISALVSRVHPLTAGVSVNHVSNLFLDKRLYDVLSLPVVEDGRPVGSISRYQLMRIFFRPYGRELFGRQPVSASMNRNPLIVGLDQSPETAAQHVAANLDTPVTEDFIVIDARGRYAGIGRVIDLLQAMEARVRRHSDDLSRAYRRLKRSQARLVQSEKMASLGQMVAGLAHEINTPLGYVRNNVEMLREAHATAGQALAAIRRMAPDASGPEALPPHLSDALSLCLRFEEEHGVEETRELLEDALHGVDQISELVGNLKNFSRLDQARMDRVDLNEALESALNIVRHIFRDRIEIVRQFGEIPPVECAPSQINQVFLNLFTNAAQAIEGDGKLLLRTHADDTHVVASIQDNGKGMPQDVMRRVFDPFFTTKEVGQGTGLGLSICYQIVRQHDGYIRVASKPGRGTRFLVGIPIQRGAANELPDEVSAYGP